VPRSRPGRPRWPRRTLSTQLLAGQVAVLVLAGLVGFALWALQLHQVLDPQYEHRALAIAETVADIPQVVTALEQRDPRHVIDPLAERIRKRTDAAYVVVADRAGIRYSHPNPLLIGQSKEPSGHVITIDGRPHMGIDHGTLGVSANGKAPIFGPARRVIGEVSVGVFEGRVSQSVSSVLPSLAGYLAVAAAIGMMAAYVLARRLKRQTFGLELTELAALVHEREATLHGIREGVLAIDRAGRLTLVNDQAHHLLGTTPSDVGRPAAEVLGSSDLRRLLPADAEAADITDRVTVHAGRLLVGSRRRVHEAGRDLGHVITVRDRTELESALRELDETRSLTDALRAQQHEFSNRMHVLSGLLDLGRVDDAATYAREVGSATAGLAAELDAEISDPRIAALLLAKATVARERGIALSVECRSPVSVDEACGDALTSIIGNLVDNAIDALSGTLPGDGPPAAIVVRLAEEDDSLVIDVDDTGPGVPAGSEEVIFTGGWSTKDASGRQRGIGLALVRQLVEALGGSVRVRPGAGARFRVALPRTRTGSRS
jgi:two-component system, CitB family, sensor kinase